MTEKLRLKLLSTINEQIAQNPTKDGRADTAETFELFLKKLGEYKGFTYEYWEKKGWNEWMEAGQPENKISFLGDSSRIIFL